MKILKTYNDFLTTEALLPSQYKKHAYTKSGQSRFKKRRYEELFKKQKEKYSGDRNAYRIYIPLIVEERENPTQEEIETFLSEKEYDVVDYFKGTCKFKTAKNPTKIGQVLTRAGADDLMKKFVEDPERKKGDVEDLMVVISRHPYDIIGSDTDRDWTNCMTIPLKETQPRMKRMREELENLTAKLKTAKNDEAINKIQNQINELEDKMYGYGEPEEGNNIHFLKHEVSQGSLVAYLIEKDDKNINDPLAVLNIKPYMNDNGDIYLNACQRSYGVQNEDFMNTVKEWLKEVNKDKEGSFFINPKVYSDEDFPAIFTSGKRLQDFFNMGEWTIDYIKDCNNIDVNSQYIENLKTNDDVDLSSIIDFRCHYNLLKDLKGIEKFTRLQKFICYGNKIKSLEGLENLTGITYLMIQNNQISDLKPIENLKNLKEFYCANNKLTTLKELEGIDITKLECQNNLLTDLKVLKNFKNLVHLRCDGNPWQYPLSKELITKFGIRYTDTDRQKFSTYELQKEFLTKYPKKIGDLVYALGSIDGFNNQIKDEFAVQIDKYKGKLEKEAKLQNKQ